MFGQDEDTGQWTAMKKRVAEEKGGAVGWGEGEGCVCVEAGMGWGGDRDQEAAGSRRDGVGAGKERKRARSFLEREESVAVIWWFVRGMILWGWERGRSSSIFYNLGVTQAQLYLFTRISVSMISISTKIIIFRAFSISFGTLLSVIAEAIYEVNDSTFNLLNIKVYSTEFPFPNNLK